MFLGTFLEKNEVSRRDRNMICKGQVHALDLSAYPHLQ